MPWTHHDTRQAEKLSEQGWRKRKKEEAEMEKLREMPTVASDKEWLLKHAHDYAFWTGRATLYRATGTDNAEDCIAQADEALKDLDAVVQRIKARKGHA